MFVFKALVVLLLFLHDYCHLITPCTSVIIGSKEYTDFVDPPEINLAESGPIHLFVVGEYVNITSQESSKTVATVLTRFYCWSFSGTTNDTYIPFNYSDPSLNCSIPGPTLVMTPDDSVQGVYLHNQLTGIGFHNSTGSFVLYKDMDVINLHTHGLHVNPLVDNIVNVKVDPRCPDELKDSSFDYECNSGDPSEADFHYYPYFINHTHYPGTHWYHAHWHGSTALHVNGGMYGGIKMLTNPNITNGSDYEPDIPDKNDHFVVTSFVWLASNEYCDYIMDEANTYCSGNGTDLTIQLVKNISDGEPYFNVQGYYPFLFNIQSYCWINCKFKSDQPLQWNHSDTPYDVEFYNEWADQDTVETFIVNGQNRVCLILICGVSFDAFGLLFCFIVCLAMFFFFFFVLLFCVLKPTLGMYLNEWHRFRIINTNMAYLVWQLNLGDSLDNDEYVSPEYCQAWLLGNDGINFETGPRFVYNNPYNGSVVIPPGGRADIMVICFEPGNYTIIASDDSRNYTFVNAPLPTENHGVMKLYVYNMTSNDSTTCSIDPIPCTSDPSNCNCSDWNCGALPCKPLPYKYSPYLEDTRDEFYPDVNGQCVSPHDVNDMNQCNIVFQRVIPGVPQKKSNNQVSVNHIKFNSAMPLLNITVGDVHEWLVTSNFHQV